MRFTEDTLKALLLELWECAADWYENPDACEEASRYAADLLERFAPEYTGPVARNK